MSLINDALKKAQKQRSGEAPVRPTLPTIGGERPAQIAHHTNQPAINTLLLPITLGFCVLIIVIGGGIWLFRDKGATSTPVATAPAPAAPVATAPVVSAPVPVVEQPRQVASTPPPATPASPVSSFVVPNVTPAATVKTPAAAPRIETPKPEPVAPTFTPTPAPTPAAAAVASIQTPPPTVAPKPDLPPAKLEPKAINYIEAIRVAGIRASTTDSKVLMNDRVYRLGDVVEHEMGLKLVGITSNSLTFEDEHGSRYTRSF